MRKNPIMERDLLNCGTFVREQIKPPASEGMDHTKIRTYAIAEGTVKFTMPEGVTLDDMTAPGITAPFKHGKIYGVDVHFHDGFIPAEDGTEYNAKAEVFIKTVERCGPNGEELNQGWRNYFYFIDLRLTEEVSSKELVIQNVFDPEYKADGRKFDDQIFDGHFCHVSGDKKRDTHISFVALPNSNNTFAQAFAERRPRLPRRSVIIG